MVKISKSVQSLKMKETKRKEKMAKEKAKEHENQLKTEGLKFVLERCLKKIEQAAKFDGARHINFITGNDGDGLILNPLLANLLRAKKFKIIESSRYIESYSGSADDGFAYAHDAYVEYSLHITW